MWVYLLWSSYKVQLVELPFAGLIWIYTLAAVDWRVSLLTQCYQTFQRGSVWQVKTVLQAVLVGISHTKWGWVFIYKSNYISFYDNKFVQILHPFFWFVFFFSLICRKICSLLWVANTFPGLPCPLILPVVCAMQNFLCLCEPIFYGFSSFCSYWTDLTIYDIKSKSPCFLLVYLQFHFSHLYFESIWNVF